MTLNLSDDELRKQFEDELGDKIEIDLCLGHPQPARINISMIARRNLPQSLAEGSHDQLIDGLMKLTHVRLDRENIVEIDNLEMLGPVTNLYLQHNAITKIENLECLVSLQFLTLAGNKVQQIQNLRVLDTLKLLDLSENRICNLDVDELPKSLVFLNLSGNPCTEAPDYRTRILSALPNLKQLDNLMLTKAEKRDAGHPVSSDDDDDDDDDEEEEEDENKGRGASGTRESVEIDDVFRLSADLILQSRARAAQYTHEHSLHMHQIEEVRSTSQQAMASARSSKGSPRSNTASPGSHGESARRFTPSPASR